MNIDQAAAELMEIFAGLTIAYGKMQLKETYKGSGKRKALHSVVKEKLTVEDWVNHLKGQSIGIVPIQDDGESCVFGAIDIDVYQQFSFDHLLRKIEELQLPLVVCKTKSGGAHCYLFINEPIPAEIVHMTLREWSAAIGYATNPRGEPTEIFPKQVKLLVEQGDTGSFINMPYVGGDNTKRSCIILDNGQLKNLSLSEFISYAREKTVGLYDIREIHIPKTPEFNDGPPCLEMLCRMGVEEGGRNTTLFAIGVYYRMAFPDSWETKIEKANHIYFDPPLSSKEITQTIKSVAKKDYAYPCKQHPLSAHCLRSTCLQRKFGVGSDLGETPILDTILKINTDPPTYILNLLDRLGKPIPVMLNSEELLSAKKIKRKCLEKLNYLPYIPKQSDWEKLLQGVMEKITVVEVPKDASASGQLLIFLDKYLSKKARDTSKTELLNGKPFIEDDKVYFRLVDFCQYLEQNHFRVFKPNEIAAIFRQEQEQNRIGHRTFNIAGKCLQTWWKYRAQEEESELEIPKEIDEDDVY